MTARPHWQGARSLVALLGPVGWIVILISTVVGYTVGVFAEGEIKTPLVMSMISFFFALLLLRLVLSLRVWPERRLALAALAVGVLLWAAASSVVNSRGPDAAHVFPAPEEVLFLASSGLIAAYVLLDASSRSGRAITAWLDAAIVCGAAAAGASVLLLPPFTAYFPQGGVPLLVSLIYPAIDVTLALVVLGQVALGSRLWSRRTIGLMLGFILFAVADSSLVLNLDTGPYAFTVTLSTMWAISMMLIVDSACGPRPTLAARSRPLPEAFVVVSFVAAVVLLLMRPSGVVGIAVALPAVLTLVASVARLVIALRASHAATEAIHLARTDDLTGLPNRRALLREIDTALAKREDFALILVGLDGFKEVNDTLGHSAGDALLELVALRMQDSLPSDIMLARVGGDEFGLVVRNSSPIELLERAQSLRHTLLAPARIEGLDLGMTSSMGIAPRLPEDTRAPDLLRRADVAMYEAKSARTGAELYSADHDEFSRHRLQMGEELRRAIRKGQLTVWFQPKVAIDAARVVGVEALVRWEHPQRGIIPPAAFLPVARRAGLMQELSETVVDLTMASAARWQRLGLHLGVAINIAPPELLGGRLLPLVYGAIARNDVSPDTVTIEVTEDSFLADPERARQILLDVRRHRVKVSIDDYGTGFSSLAYLRDLPVDELKLDRSFVSTVCSDERSRLIVASTIDMAHALDLIVVAEGVENADVAGVVSSLGVDLMQGYFFSPPMQSNLVESWVRSAGHLNGAMHIVHSEEARALDA
jgi:diguanylate cyclase (GGDEF)-like protein